MARTEDGQADFEIKHLRPADLYALRAAVLRSGRVKQVTVADDDAPETLHIGAVTADGEVVGTSSYYRYALPEHPEEGVVQLRMMAVAPNVQGRGIGGAILEHAVSELVARGDHLLWANARDTALPFYLAHDFQIVAGSEFIHDETGLPHTVVERRI